MLLKRNITLIKNYAFKFGFVSGKKVCSDFFDWSNLKPLCMGGVI